MATVAGLVDMTNLKHFQPILGALAQRPYCEYPLRNLASPAM